MNSENDNTDDTNDDILWFETEATGFIGAPPQGSTAGLPARVVRRIRRRAKPDRLLEGVIVGFFRSGVRPPSTWRAPTPPRLPSAKPYSRPAVSPVMAMTARATRHSALRT